MTVFVTGAGKNGVTGRLVRDHFQRNYDILAPGSDTLDLTNGEAVTEYFNCHAIDFVVHCATFRPATARAENFANDLLESNLRMFFNLSAQRHRFRKMIYFGSGAEFDKRRPLHDVGESDFGHSVPADLYGFGKYVMNLHARAADNIYNFRLFGTINPYERPSKNVVSNLCVKALKGLPLTLKRDCRFSFAYLPDVLPLIDYALTHDLRYHDYNVVMPQTYLLSEIASLVGRLTDQDGAVCFSDAGLSNEYTADNHRLIAEFKAQFTTLESAVSAVLDHYRPLAKDIAEEDLDIRWRRS